MIKKSFSGKQSKTLTDSSIAFTPTNISKEDKKEEQILESFKRYGPVSSFLSCYFNLTKTTLGTGLIFYPITFARCGIFYTFIGIFLGSFFSILGFYFYLRANKKSGPLSYSQLSSQYNRPTYIITHITIIMKTLIVSIGYLVNLRDIYLSLNFKFLNSIHPKLIILVHTALLSPLVAMKRYVYLQYSSFIGMLGVFYLTSLAVVKFFLKKEYFKSNTKATLKDFLCRLSFFVFSYTAHQTIVPIQNDFFEYSVTFFVGVVVACSITISLLYTIIGVLISKSYYMEGLNYDTSVLTVFEQDLSTLIARLMYLILLSFSIPLQLLPARDQMIELVFGSKGGRSEKSKRYFMVLALLTFCYGIFALDLNIETFQNVSGGCVSVILCFVLPALLFYGLCWSEATFIDKIIFYLLQIFGLFVFVVFCLKNLNLLG